MRLSIMKNLVNYFKELIKYNSYLDVFFLGAWLGLSIYSIISQNWSNFIINLLVSSLLFQIMHLKYKLAVRSKEIIDACITIINSEVEGLKDKAEQSEGDNEKEFCRCKYGSMITYNHPCKNGCEKTKE